MVSEEPGGLIWLPSIAAAPDPDEFLREVLEGWKRQQLAQNLGLNTIRRRSRSVLRMTSFAGKAPWEWLPGDADDFFSHLRGVQNLSHNTVRAYQADVKLFLDFAGDSAYDWNARCGQLFGTVFSQVLSELNRATHAQETGEASKRPFSIQELQEFFDLADLEPERILNSGRKGALAAWRDAVMFKTIYAWGLRHNEARHLILADFSRNIRAPSFGEWGLLRVRQGKAMKGSAPKQRTVLTVFDWATEMLDHWKRVGHPRFGLHRATPLFPTDTGKMLDQAYLRRRFHAFIQELGFAPGLDIHSFRRSYATNLQIDAGYDVSFVQLQLGHEHASTTSIYTVASPDYRTRELNRVLTGTLERSGATLPHPKRKESQ